MIKEVVDTIPKEQKVAMMHFSQIYPLPEPDNFDYIELLKNEHHHLHRKQRQWAVCEINKGRDRVLNSHQISKYDGRPFTIENLKEGLHAYI